MDDRNIELAAELVTRRYIEAGADALRSHARVLRSLLAQRSCPDEGMDDTAIEYLLHQLALMDSNTFRGQTGAGEREGRIASALVRRRVYGMTHGIGRSGDLTSDQPKAAGSSLMYQLTNAMALDLIKQSGAGNTRGALVVPMATGMTISLVLRTIANQRMKEAEARCAASGCEVPAPPNIVIWPRIDQKTSLKCIEAAGLRAFPVSLRPAPLQPSAGDYLHSGEDEDTRSSEGGGSCSMHEHCTSHPFFLQVDVDDVHEAIEAAGGPSRVLCVLSTTSCFAPRLPDDVVDISRLCAELDIAFVINNAYGLQSRTIMSKIDTAQRLGRVDYFIQSTDKNFMVPVGGAIVCAADAGRVAQVAALYAGRASAAPIMDMFITALSLGRRGMRQLWEKRYEVREDLVWRLRSFARARGERVIEESTRCSANNNSMSMSRSNTSGVLKHSSVSGRSSRQGARSRKSTPPPTSVKWLPRNDISVALTMQHYEPPQSRKKKNNHSNNNHNKPPTAAAAGRSSGNSTSDDNNRHRMATVLPEQDADVSHDDSHVDDVSEASAWTAARGLGARLFRRGVTGLRVITPDSETVTTIAGCTFRSYGTHDDAAVSCAMLVMACGIGMTTEDVTSLMTRLEEEWPVPKSVRGPLSTF